MERGTELIFPMTGEFWLPVSAFYLLLVVIACVLAIKRPLVAAVLYVWIDLFPVQLVFPVGPFDKQPLSLYLGAAIAIGAFVNRPKVIPRSPLAGLLLLYAVWITATTLLAAFPQAAWIKWDRVAKTILAVLLIASLCRSRRDIEALCWSICLSTFLLGIGGALLLVEFRGDGLEGSTSSYINGPVDRNMVAARLVAILPLLRYLYSHGRLFLGQKLRKPLLAVLGVMTALSIVGSYSRGALIGAGIMGVFYALTSRRGAKALLFAAILAGLALPLAPDTWVDRIASINDYSDDMSSTERLEAWRFGFNYALSHPIFGGGFRIAMANTNGTETHSFIFESIAEQGFAGAGIFFWMLFAAFARGKALKRAVRRKRNSFWIADLTTALRLAVIGLMGAGLFLNTAGEPMLFYLLMCVLAADFVVNSRPVKGRLAAAITNRRARVQRLRRKRTVTPEAGASTQTESAADAHAN